MVVISGPDATAGSMPIFLKNIGISVPSSDAIIIETNNDTPMHAETASAPQYSMGGSGYPSTSYSGTTATPSASSSNASVTSAPMHGATTTSPMYGGSISHPTYGTLYGGTAAPTPSAPTTPTSFEPDDPIPDREDKDGSKRIPKFVKFFMKKDGEEDEDETK